VTQRSTASSLRGQIARNHSYNKRKLALMAAHAAVEFESNNQSARPAAVIYIT
jgi:hypothetical protein